MKKKLFWVPLLAGLLSMFFLYAIGNIFEIALLSWNFYKENPSEGAIESGGSVIPAIIGFIVVFVTERILKNKQKDSSNLV